MARIHLGGAGGSPTNNMIRSLRQSHRQDYLIGTSSSASDLFLAEVDERHLVPPALSPEYEDTLLTLLSRRTPHFLHVQNDYEVRAVSKLRDQIHHLGVITFLPAPETVEICVDKYRSYEAWAGAGLRVPETFLLNSPSDLGEAFERLKGEVWIRATIGGGGHGAVPTDSFEFAKLWIDRLEGWGRFTAAKKLTERSVTWLSIWFEGALVVAQSRRRRSWSFGDRTLSGVTGITGVAETCSDPTVDELAIDAIAAIDPSPHGIFGVDMTYDKDGQPNLTEINIGRFFTTVHFFTEAGLNLPAIYCDIALDGKFPSLERRINPLEDGLVWIRGMDVAPVLTTTGELRKQSEPWW